MNRVHNNDDFEEIVANTIDEIKSRATNYSDLTDELRQNEDVIEAVLSYTPDQFDFHDVPNIYGLSYGAKKAVLFCDGKALIALEETDKNNEGLVLDAIINMPSAIQYASEEIKDNKDVVLYSVSLDGDNLMYASDRLRKDKDVIDWTRRQNFSSAIRYGIFDTDDSQMNVYMDQFQDSLFPIADFFVDTNSSPEVIQKVLDVADQKGQTDSKFYLRTLKGMDCKEFQGAKNSVAHIMVNHVVASLTGNQLKKVKLKNDLLNDVIQQEILRRSISKIHQKKTIKLVKRTRKIL